ncbi:MAG: hypothetical protein QF570_00705 [Myxococcota bacterium]|nr:hypothetical protein [Myxococcota bacterium]
MLGWSCVAWTAIEVARLVVRARKTHRFRTSRPPHFSAFGRDGEAIDVDIVP